MLHSVVKGLILAFILTAPLVHGEESAAKDGDAKVVDFKTLKSPIPYSKQSIKRGRLWFVRECAACHGPDGKAQIDIIADATDLTNTKRWYSGSAEGEIYRSIRDGAGIAMPPYKAKIKKDDDLWHLVNFIRSLWPKDQRPELVEEKPKEAAADGASSAAEGESNE